MFWSDDIKLSSETIKKSKKKFPKKLLKVFSKQIPLKYPLTKFSLSECKGKEIHITGSYIRTCTKKCVYVFHITWHKKDEIQPNNKQNNIEIQSCINCDSLRLNPVNHA